MRARRASALCITATALAMSLAGCTDWKDAQRARAGEYTVMLKTEPSPAEVGHAAKLSIGIRDGADRTVRACAASFRQFMPEHEMSSDDTLVKLEESRSGVYAGQAAEFSIGGDWRIEVSFDCGTSPQKAVFDMHLEWPE